MNPTPVPAAPLPPGPSAGKPVPRKWHREPLVWMLVAIPGSAVVMGVVLLTLAASSYDGLVADDYYKRGLEINRSLARDELAAHLGVGAAVDVDAAGQVRVVLTSATPMPPSPSLTLAFLHATRQGEDVTAELRHAGGGRYVGALPRASNGGGHLQIGTADWRLSARVQAPLANQRITLAATDKAATRLSTP